LQGDKQALIRAYKIVLRDALESRPSGIRLRIATTIGKNKSFISQVTNPKYKTPLPEKYVDPILEVVHFTPAERERFLDIYRQAHPRARQAPPERKPPHNTRTVKIEMPRLGSRALERKLDALVADFARQIGELFEGGRSS
jgi:hypothetical protein